MKMIYHFNKKTMTTSELAAQYGVALPETCKELNWQGETIFYWFICDNTQKALLHIIQENRDGEKYYHSINGSFAHNKFKIYSAAQMHEIANVICNELDIIKAQPKEIRMSYFLRLLSQEPQCENLSETAVQYYLKLKKENLL